MDASIIIVSWNTKELLKNCLNGLLTQKNVLCEIFVVDNNSQDGTREMLSYEFPNVKVLYNTQNRGFAAANNQALRIASGNHLLLVNPDIEFTDTNTVQKIIEYQKNTGHGIVGCKLENSDRSLQPSVRSFPTFLPQLLLMLKLHIVLPRLSLFKKYFQRDFDYYSSQAVDQVSGAFFSISRLCFKKTGHLDEGFWIWFEEVDYCKRARMGGFTTGYFSGTSVIHHGGQSFQKIMPYSRQKRFNASLKLYAKKYFSPWQYLLLSIASPISLFLARLTPKKQRLRSYS